MKKKKYLTSKQLKPGKSYDAFSPDGTPIRGTYDRMYAIAEMFSVDVDQDGSISPAYVGESEIDWDSQCPEQEEGEDLYIDDDGYTYRFSQLKFLEVKE